MNDNFEKQLLDELLNFSVPIIPSTTRFWMIRTQRGYFYNEFVTKRFVALAWNIIDNSTDFSDESRDMLKDDILMEFEDIHRPSTVINKCFSFIHEIQEGDILIIPSAGSQYITLATAGKYFEDASKTVDLEHRVISKIEHNDVDISDVSCPYKKRRHISLLRTVKNEDLNYSLCRAISNYHGLSNMDPYANHILNSLYNYYTFKGTTVLVYNVKKSDPIRPRELGNILYGTTEFLTQIAQDDQISTQVSLNSPGDIVFYVLSFCKTNWSYVFGLLILLGGGSAFTFKVPGLVEIIKNIFNAPAEHQEKKAIADLKTLEVIEKRLEIYEKLKASGINPETLNQPIEAIASSCSSLQIEPITVNDEHAAILPAEAVAPESHDTDEE